MPSRRVGPNAASAPSDDLAPHGELSLCQAELVERVRWLILLRWLAFAGVFITILATRYFFDSLLPWDRLIIASLVIPAYNLVFWIAWRGVGRDGAAHVERASSWLTNAQISLDLLILGVLIHLSGGIENLFCFYFVFHMVIASILLSRRAAFAQATFAVTIFSVVAAGEYYGLLPHYESPIGARLPDLHRCGILIIAAGWVITTLLYATVYLATSISARLRWREDQVMFLSEQNKRNAEQLRAACRKLADTERAKSAYARKVAHELRSPLAAIDSLLLAVLESLQGEISKQAVEMIGRARRRTGELLAVVRDLLVLAQARDAQHCGSVTEVDLQRALENVAYLFAAQMEERHIALQSEVCPGLPRLRGDPEGLQEVLTNLIANAIKYSPEGGTVEVRVSCADGTVEIQVSDNGIGIPPEEQDKIFDEFYRSPNAREFADGTGLGLSIVKNIIEAHSGTIAVTSASEAGTKFTVRLPVANGIEIGNRE